MELWIIATFLAASFQTVRFMLQKHLSTATLSPGGATLARFLYSAPFAVVLVAIYAPLNGFALPPMPAAFWGFAALGGFCQVVATIFLVALFQRRNFAVGVAFTKTAVLQAVPLAWVLIGDSVTWSGLAAIFVGFLGVLLLTKTPSDGGAWWEGLRSPAALLGLASGAFFSVSGVSYRGASLELSAEDPFLRAAITLAAVTTMQTIGLSIWLRLREPGQIRRVVQSWRVSGLVGLTSMAGSLGWFTAFTLQHAAYVNAVGQIELILSMFASVFFFRERITAREFAGIAILTASILWLILSI